MQPTSSWIDVHHPKPIWTLQNSMLINCYAIESHTELLNLHGANFLIGKHYLSLFSGNERKAAFGVW